ncbi:hypothetical protein GX917_00575 [Candidatus Falkowbacteria bacterium]|jgi:hypothetical protein|nr:hypothetical protein [Candidatus Falkowbacteria bacterium]
MPRVSKKNDVDEVKKTTKKKSSTAKASVRATKTAKTSPKSSAKVSSKASTKSSKSSSKPSTKTSPKAATKKATDSVKKKKVQPVIVDIIEDDEEMDNFFPDLPELKAEVVVEDMLIDETEADIVTKKKSKEVEEHYSAEEIDQQKKYFSKFISEKEEKRRKLADGDDDYLERGEAVKKSVGLYRNLVWKFVGLTVILVLIVLYFSFSKLVINITPNGETLNDSLLIKVIPARFLGENASSTPNDYLEEVDFREVVDGAIQEVEISEEKTFLASGEEPVGEEIYGKVTLINNSAKNQPLVATTRLLSPDNKLFRIKEAVNIPAHGEVEVEIYADKPSRDLAISPTTFTIPGLWIGLQDKIYAKSDTEFIYRQKVKKYVKASDIDAATKEMGDLLLSKVKLSQPEDITTGVIYEALAPMTIESSAKIGDSVDEFTVKAKEKFVVISYSKKQASELAKNKLSLLVPDDKELVGYDEKNIAYIFDDYNQKTGVASIKINFNGTMILKSNTEIIDKKQIVNLNRDQLENYLKTFPEIKTFELKFYPSFITRAPRLPERISVVID